MAVKRVYHALKLVLGRDIRFPSQSVNTWGIRSENRVLFAHLLMAFFYCLSGNLIAEQDVSDIQKQAVDKNPSLVSAVTWLWTS